MRGGVLLTVAEQSPDRVRVLPQIIFPLYTTTPGMGGVHSANTDDGSRNWRYLSTEDSQYLGDMMGRSSPAVDEGGNVFIGMDQVVQGEGQVPPVLLALNNQGERVWVDPGVQPGPIYNPIGLRSPMMGYEEAGSPATARVYFSRTGIVQAFSPGITCPSTDPLKTCSGHGICGCTTGHCACEVLDCFYGDDCGTEQTCNENGDCLDGAPRAVSLPWPRTLAHGRCVALFLRRCVRLHQPLLLGTSVRHTQHVL